MMFYRLLVVAIVAACTADIFAFAFAFTSTTHRHRINRFSSISIQTKMSTDISADTTASKYNSNSNSNSNDTSLEATRVTTNDNINDNYNNDSDWWKSFALNDSKLGHTSRTDFPILTSTKHFEQETNGDGNDDDDDDNNKNQPKQLIYFDSAATSQKPNQVTNKLTSYYETINSNVHRGAHTLSQRATAEYEAARDKVKSLINAYSRNEIVFTSGATEALNLIASTYGRANIQQGDEILISEAEHHSNIVPWQMLAEEKGAILKYIPIDIEKQCLDFENDTLNNLITSKTKIVSIQHVSNVLASITPIETLVAKVKERAHDDCVIILDACQSVPHMVVDVQSLGVDFIAASGHKMCAPTGIGFLWGREEILNSMPPYMGGGEMIDEVSMTHSTYAKAPARFEAGTPQIAQAIGLGAAIDYLESIGGMERIYSYEHELGEYLMKRMAEVEGITVLGPELGVDRAAIVAFVCDNVHPSDLSTFMDMDGVAIRAGHHCCQPLHRALGHSHSARASLYFYNTKEEIDSFVSILTETLVFFGGTNEAGVHDDFVPFI